MGEGSGGVLAADDIFGSTGSFKCSIYLAFRMLT